MQSFERVLVQNITHGLSPSLCEAIQNISRWRLIQTAFPHIMHCCAAMLRNHERDMKFGTNETKLMYTLHWIILDSASECEDIDMEKFSSGPSAPRNIHSYLHSLDTIQLFIFLFAPLIHTLKESDFQSLKLENGLRLWQPLWDFSEPDVPCFSMPVKQNRNFIKAQRNVLKVNTNAANIYIGKGTSSENIHLGFESFSPPAISVISHPCSTNGGGTINEQHSPLAPIVRMSDICATSTLSGDTQSVSQVTSLYVRFH